MYTKPTRGLNNSKCYSATKEHTIKEKRIKKNKNEGKKSKCLIKYGHKFNGKKEKKNIYR